jgi:nucleotide-binding universal stress UspA family protein
MQEYAQLGLERLQFFVRQALDRQLQIEILQPAGEAGQTICETAKNQSVDSIVMGRNQKSVFSEMFLGSTSNYVLHHAPCSVFIIYQ